MSSINVGEMFKQYQTEDQITALPPGTYQASIESAKASISGNGNATIRPVFKCTAGPYAGRKFMAGQFTLSDKARQIFFRNMACMGLDSNFLTAATAMEDIAKALVGRQIELELVVRQWQGEDRNEIPVGRIKLLSAPPLPGLGAAPGGAPVAVAAPPIPVVAPTPVAPTPVAAEPVVAPVPVAAPAPTAAPVAPPTAPPVPVAAGAAIEDPGF